VVFGGWRGGQEVLPGFEQGTWLSGGLVAMVAAVVAVAAEEEDARDEDEGAEDGGEDGCVDV
jgi:hypothetical protein